MICFWVETLGRLVLNHRMILGSNRLYIFSTTVLLRIKYVLSAGTCITKIGPWFYIRCARKIDGLMGPVSMLNGDVTDFKNIVVLIHVVSLCHLFELNSADDLLLIQISTGAGSSS